MNLGGYLMLEQIILNKDAKHTEQILHTAGFDLDRPFNSFQSKNVDGIIHQQMEDSEFITCLIERVQALEDRLNGPG